MAIEVGMTGTAETVVTKDLTALTAGSGTLEVFATPHMAALMERTAWTLVQPQLEEGKTTVGTSLSIVHSSATPVGMRVRAAATVTAVEGKKICYEVVAEDEAGEIGRGTHERVIVTETSFVKRTYEKG